MSLATKKMNAQKRKYFSGLFQGLLLAIIGAFGGIKILQNGIGVGPSNDNGLAGKLYKMMENMMGRGENAEKLVIICFSGVFFIIALIGLYYVVRAGVQMPSKRTLLGKSILLQAQKNESFDDVVDSINADMEFEPYVFGDVSIGRKWILQMEAMRLSSIRGVFWLDTGKEEYVLCCVDEAQNRWAASWTYADDRDSAMEHLRTTLPEVISGDMGAFKAFLRGEAVEEQEEEDGLELAKPLSIPQDTQFTFIKPDGIPTSNFAYEDVLQALRTLELDRNIALQPLTSGRTKVMQLGFRRADEQQWMAFLIYMEYGEECAATKLMDEGEAAKMLHDLMQQKQLPELVRWSAAKIKQ